jgi:outer membrane protein assembly factor BamB
MRCFVCVLILLLCGSLAVAENWPQWRGAALDGVSQEKNLPAKWSKSENVLWRLPLPGPGGATPVVWGERIFVTAPDGDDLLLLCVGTDGKELWRQTVSRGNREVNGDEGNSCSPSPSTDGRHVWTFFTDGVLACYTVEGKQVWKTNLQDRYGKFKIQFGMTSTPVLDRGRLYMQLIHGEGNAKTREAMVLALDAATGKEIWKQPRPSDAVEECEHSYASPIVYRDEKREFLLTHGADFVIAHDLNDGRELWRCGGLNPKSGYNPTLRFVASPVQGEGRIIVPSAKNGPVICLKPELQGDVTRNEDAYFWKIEQGTPDVPSPLIHDGLVYLCRENGNLICLDASTGEKYYEERTVRERHRASPVYADGKIYITARNGVVTVVSAGREFQMLAQNTLGEGMSASPAIANGRLYLRTEDALYAVGK